MDQESRCHITMRAYMRRRLYALVLLCMVITVIVLRKAEYTSPKHVHLDKHVAYYEGFEEKSALNHEPVYPDIKLVNEKPATAIKMQAHYPVSDTNVSRSNQRSLIDASGCQIPDMQAFSLSAKEHYSPAIPLRCSRRVKKYRINHAVDVEEDQISGSPVLRSPPPGLKCCFRHIKRRSRDDNNYKYTEECKPIELLMAPEEVEDSESSTKNPEFVRVSCKKPDDSEEWSNEEYVDVHAFVPLKEEVEWRCNEAPKHADQLSVVILGVDSVSRLNMIRHLPETYKLLTSPPLKATTLLGYNKVADNTFPNLIPLLVGHSIDELRQVCNWPSGSETWSSKFDSCPIIWKKFAKRGYRTMYGEECPHLSTFNFQKAGFKDPPTDYYLRPLLLAASDEIGHTRADNCILCLGRRSGVALLLDYATQFIRRFAAVRHFAFVWATSLTHDGLNMAGLADSPFAATLRGLIKRKDLANTALFFISDHGVRTGAFRLTPQGRLEERLPFVSVAFPEWFRQRFPVAMANFEANARNRLTTPFDVHETLRDLVAPDEFMHDDAIKRRMQELKEHKVQPRGISLFLEIPESRNCENAGIPRHWCTCLSYRPLSLDDPGLQNAAEALVEHINERFLEPHRHRGCQTLSLLRIIEARIGVAKTKDLEEENEKAAAGIKEYALTIETIPGGALFEGAVRSYKRRGGGRNRNKVSFEVADTISRLNRYGNQSACVDDWVVKLYCYCR